MLCQRARRYTPRETMLVNSGGSGGAIGDPEVRGATGRAGSFYHVHLNTEDPQRSRQFYQRVFGAMPVQFADRTDALFTGRGFILLSEVDSPPKDMERTVVRHIGWAGIDGPS